jgi:hypothetical protein
MVQVSSNIRSNKAITEYVLANDLIVTRQKEIKELEARMNALHSTVLDDIGEGRAVKIGAQIRLLKPVVVRSIGCPDNVAATDKCIELGLAHQTRTENWLAPATFSKYIKEGKLPESLAKITDTMTIVVT